MNARPLRNQTPAQRALGLVADENRMRARAAQVVLEDMENASAIGQSGTGDEDAAPCNSTCTSPVPGQARFTLSVPSEPGTRLVNP